MKPSAKLTAASAVILTASLLSGCWEPAQDSSKKTRHAAAESSAKDDLFSLVADNLNRLQDFDANPALVRDRLNHWIRQESITARWEPDPLLETIDQSLRELPQVQRLDRLEFTLEDVKFLETVAWMRDISRRARGDRLEELPMAERLFDWTVRNLQLERDSAQNEPRLPDEILLAGRATALERAWVFSLLARQQKLDVVILQVAPSDSPNRRRPLAALLHGKELYLFDPALGLPIPPAAGAGVATLATVRSDEKILRGLDLDDEHSYPLKPGDFESATALVEASPGFLAQKMRAVEARLSGKQSLVLGTHAHALADKIKEAGIGEVAILGIPYAVLLRRSQWNEAEQKAYTRQLLLFQPEAPLRKPRIDHLRGEFDGEKGAKRRYLNARPSKELLADIKEHPEKHLPREIVEKMPVSSLDRLAFEQVKMMEEAKEYASFWLGLVAFDEADYPVAIDYFAERTLKASPDGRWTAGARYNLARTYEVSGDPDKAIALYREDDSPQAHGNRLRARQLEAVSASKDAAPESKPDAETAP